MNEIMNENVKIMDATNNDYKITQPIKQEESKFYTIYSYKLARTLLHKGCTIADIGLNTKMKGIVFHFVNEPKLHEIIKLQHEINEAHKKMNGFNKPTMKSNKEKTFKLVGDTFQARLGVIFNEGEEVDEEDEADLKTEKITTGVAVNGVEQVAQEATTIIEERNDTNEFVQTTAS